ncbi:uncharacterized protein LOC120336894 isoform X2 [Styela clava]
MNSKLYGHILLSLLHLLSQSKNLFVNAQEPTQTIKTDDGYLLERFDTEVYTMNSAEQKCNARNAWLVRIKNTNMQNKINALLSGATAKNPNGNYFIGLTKVSGSWKWTDENHAAWPTNWASGEGDDGSTCASINYDDGKWTDITCYAFRRYICQSELLTITPTYQVMVVVRGNTVSINVKIRSYDGAIGLKVFKLPDKTNRVLAVTNVGSSHTYITPPINDFQSVIYEFVVTLTADSRSYTRSAKVRLNVHYPVNITNIFPTAISSPVTSGLNYVTCEASGAPSAQVVWIRNGTSVPSSRDSSVYQWKPTGKSILYIMNAVLSDTGTYTCRATNNIGEPAQATTDEREIELTVYGPPVIINGKVEECSVGGKVTIEWKPNNQTIGVVHRISATREGDTIANYTQNITAQTFQTTIIEKLAPYTNYTIKITVCPDECITKLHAQTVIKTGIGIPNPVTDARVEKISDQQCNITWSWLESIPKADTTLEVDEEAKLVQLSPSLTQQILSTNYTYKATELDSYRVQVKTKPNRNYTFYVKAKSCAGGSNRVAAVGKCVTDVAAPENVPPPSTIPPTGNSQTRTIQITMPDETNGPISCIFIVMKYGGNTSEDAQVTTDQLERASEAALADASDGKEYLAMAIQRSTIEGFVVEKTLGDGTSSTCDIPSSVSSTDSSRKRRSAMQTITGKNLKLEMGATYTYYAVTSTTNGTKVWLKQSSSVSFEHKKAEGNSMIWIVGVVIALVLLILIIIIVVCFRKRRGEKYDDVTYIKETNTAVIRAPSLSTREDEGDVYANVGAQVDDSRSTTLIALKDLFSVFEDQNANNGTKFFNEFTKMKQEAVTTFTTKLASKESLRKKNRYKNILPFDLSRVHLKGEDEESYINACYVHGYSKSKKFIATQGPLSSTVNDFWRMIVEQKSKVIIMLTKCFEAQKRKCEKYWPDLGKTQKYGSVKVSCDDDRSYGGYNIRIFKISHGDSPAYQVEQYHFLNWPDHGVPITTSSFYRFYEGCMESHGNEDYPIIVHCSAGAGRTGAFIGYDNLIEEAARTNHVDIYQCVIKMRQQRLDMVQTSDQYKLLHKFLLEYHLFKDTDSDEFGIKAKIQEDKKSANGTSKIMQEFENVKIASSISKISAKNAEKYKVVIKWQPEDEEEKTSINANHIEAYNESIRMIACEGPVLSNDDNFWRAIFDNDVTTIVMLDDQNRRETQYWPINEGEPCRAGRGLVQLLKSSPNAQYVERHFLMARDGKKKSITQFHIPGLNPTACPKDVTAFVEVIHKIQTKAERRDLSTILVHCRDGLGKTGAFCAILNLISRLKVEEKADVFRVVKDLRDCRAGMIQKLEEYRFCYKALKHWFNNDYKESAVEENAYENTAQSKQQEEAIYENHQPGNK